jgi:hypothetical protein
VTIFGIAPASVLEVIPVEANVFWAFSAIYGPFGTLLLSGFFHHLRRRIL